MLSGFGLRGTIDSAAIIGHDRQTSYVAESTLLPATLIASLADSVAGDASVGKL